MASCESREPFPNLPLLIYQPRLTVKDKSFHPDHHGQQYLIDGIEYTPEKDGATINDAKAQLSRVAATFQQVLEDKKVDAIMWPFMAAPSFVSTSNGFPTVILSSLVLISCDCGY